jgi:hypothetical protein
MKKLVATGTIAAMMVIGAAPAAFAADAVGGDVDISYLDASQTQAAAAAQSQEGDATAGDLGSAAAIDQSLTIEQSQVNAGDGGVAAGGSLFLF